MSRGCGVPIRMYRGTVKIEGPAIDHHRHYEGASATVAISTFAVGCAGMQINIDAPGYTMLIGAFRTIHSAGDCHGLRPRNEVVGGRLVPFRRECGSCSRSYRGTVDARSLHYKSQMCKKPPVSEETEGVN